MSKDIKAEIHRLIDSIEDNTVLQIVAEDIAYYAANKDIPDDLDSMQIQELNEAIGEADNGDTIAWIDFKSTMNEWKKE